VEKSLEEQKHIETQVMAPLNETQVFHGSVNCFPMESSGFYSTTSLRPAQPEPDIPTKHAPVGTGIFTYMEWFKVIGFFVGKYSSPMEHIGSIPPCKVAYYCEAAFEYLLISSFIPELSLNMR